MCRFVFACLALAASLFTLTPLSSRAAWQMQQAKLMTPWAKDVTPDKVRPEYPRPQMVRSDWQNLNGLGTTP